MQICFKKSSGWTQPYEAIIDTGAPLSIIPPAIWQEIEKEILAEEHKIRGIVSKKDSYLSVKIANISCVLMDEKSVSEEVKIKAYLSLETKAPLVLGLENIISMARLYINLKDNEGYIEL